MQDCQSIGGTTILKGIRFQVLDESCDTSSIVCVGSESRSSFLDHFNFVYEFLLVLGPKQYLSILKEV